MLKAARKQTFPIGEKQFEWQQISHQKMEAREKGHSIFHVLKEKSNQFIILYLVTISFKREGKSGHL